MRQDGTVQRITGRAWLVWGVAVAAYLVAVLQRTTLTVAGLDAAARFDVTAAALSTIAVMQLVFYASMQIPVGVMVDRVGPRALVMAGATLMAVGQLTIGLAHTLPLAILARALVGIGDAMTWLSVIRLVASWMPARRVPLMTQVTALVGSFGQILSVIPFAALLHVQGWTPAFISAAALSTMMIALTALAVRDTPTGPARHTIDRTSRQVLSDVRETWAEPGTRLGWWTHFLTPMSNMMFVFLWGYPFLVSGQGISKAEASGLLTLLTVVGMISGPLLGVGVSRYPRRRSWFVLIPVALNIFAWTAVLLLDGPAPRWLLIALIATLAVCGPASVIAFDYARTFNPPGRYGTASGIVNTGGFFAGLVTILAVGVILNLVGSGTSYSLEGFRIALCFQYAMWALGFAGFLRARRLVRASGTTRMSGPSHR